MVCRSMRFFTTSSSGLRPTSSLPRPSARFTRSPRPRSSRRCRIGSAGNLPSISLAPQDLAQVWQSIDVVAEALDVATQASELQSSIKGRIETIVEKTNGSPSRSIACLEWLEPLMAAGNWVPELVSLAGGVDLFGKPGEHSPWLAWDELERADPDIILALPCGFGLERTRQESAVLCQHDSWADCGRSENTRRFLPMVISFSTAPVPVWSSPWRFSPRLSIPRFSPRATREPDGNGCNKIRCPRVVR